MIRPKKIYRPSLNATDLADMIMESKNLVIGSVASERFSKEEEKLYRDVYFEPAAIVITPKLWYGVRKDINSQMFISSLNNEEFMGLPVAIHEVRYNSDSQDWVQIV